MLVDNLRLFFGLYRHPARAMGRIVDEGSLLFGAGAVLVVGLLMAAGGVIPMYATMRAQLEGLTRAPGARAKTPGVPGTATSPAPSPSPADADDEPDGPPVRVPHASPQAMIGRTLTGITSMSVVGTLFGLAVLYVPACILVLTFVAPVGSFGVAFQRDYGALLACVLFSWSAAELPFALAGLAIPGVAWLARLGLWAATALVFAVFMVMAIRTVFGVETPPAVGATLLGSLGLLLAPIAPFLASPFILYLAWQYFRGDIAGVQWSFGRRQSFKRHLHAATLNPRDADAHYHLGLIHQQRRQIPEAIERFQKAVEIDPGEVDAHYQLGRIARGEKRYEDAIRHFGEVVKRDDKHSRHEVWREIGCTYLESTSFENALWAFEKFVTARPHDPEGLYLRGEALSALDRKDEAAEAYRRAVEAADTMPAYRRREVSRWKKAAAERLATSRP